MATLAARDLDVEEALAHLHEDGYVVLEGLLSQDELRKIRNDATELFARERAEPYEPEDGPESPDDIELNEYFGKTYNISEAEQVRVMRRVRHTRALNYGTPWPVPPGRMNKGFLHLPTLFDNDASQRVLNLPNKLDACGRLIEDPTVLRLTRSVLDEDCILSDTGLTSIGPHTDGGAWHVDAPLTQLPEPLPEIPLGVQNVWMLDDFTTENGATRVVPGSHLSRKKPGWGYDDIEGEVILTAPAGSMAIWVSNTWHRSGPNYTGAPRRAVLSYYSRSWVKPFSDYQATMPAEIAKRYSPTSRYLLGWSATGPKRG